MSTIPSSLDVSNAFVDLSGVSSSETGNPYDALITACEDRPVELILTDLVLYLL